MDMASISIWISNAQVVSLTGVYLANVVVGCTQSAIAGGDAVEIQCYVVLMKPVHVFLFSASLLLVAVDNF